MGRMWTCSACGRSFANANQWHSCGNPNLDDILAEHAEDVAALYGAVESALGEAGEFRVHPQKTRIAFISRMTFASVILSRRWLDLSFILPEPIDDLRIRSIELHGPTSFGHQVRLHDAAEVDGEVRRWLAEALRRGDQETLDPNAHVEPLVGRPLAIIAVPLRLTVCRYLDGLALRTPRYASEAFGAHRRVDVRVAGQHHAGRIQETGEGGLLLVVGSALSELGLGEGDHTDVLLKADL